MSRTALYKANLGRREYLVEAVPHLIAEGCIEDDGSRLVPVRPFRHGEAGSPVPKPFPTVPGSTLPLGSHGSPSYKEGTGNGEVDAAELDRLQTLGDELGLT